jgi:hypothetical protein
MSWRRYQSQVLPGKRKPPRNPTAKQVDRAILYRLMQVERAISCRLIQAWTCRWVGSLVGVVGVVVPSGEVVGVMVPSGGVGTGSGLLTV